MSSKIVFRVTLLGDGAVGKTSLRNRFMGKGFNATHLMTVGADFAAKSMNLTVDNEHYDITFQVWDVAGQKRFQDIRSRFYGGSLAGICVFDVTRPDSFMNLTSWINEIWKHNGSGVIPLIILGNKSDIRDKNSVEIKKAIDYAKALSTKTTPYGFEVLYYETSAMDGKNVDVAFNKIAEIIIRKMKSEGKV